MNSLIKQAVHLPVLVRLSLFAMLCLVIVFLACKNILELQSVVISNNESKLLQLNNEINQYHRERQSIQLQKRNFNTIKRQLSQFEVRLASFNRNAPERQLLESALKSKIKTQEIKISKQLRDEFGNYYLVNLKVAGKQPNINQFFALVLKQQELAIWGQLEFKQTESQLSISLEIRYYFELEKDVQN